MNCSHFETLLSDFAERQLDGPVQAAAQAHVEECPGCAELFREVDGLRRQLEDFPVVTPPEGLVHKILERTSGIPEKRSIWEDFLLPTIRPFLTQRFAFATAMLFVFLSLMVNLVGPPVGAALSPAGLAEGADRLGGQISKAWAQMQDLKTQAFEEARLLSEDLYGRLDYHLISLLFENYNETVEGQSAGTPDAPAPAPESSEEDPDQ